MTEFDLYAEENEPRVAFQYTVYGVRVPWRQDTRDITVNVSLIVYDQDNLVSIDFNRTTWDLGDLTEDVKQHAQAIWDWLSEWELVELKRIGPEDSEYFATDKFFKRAGDIRESL